MLGVTDDAFSSWIQLLVQAGALGILIALAVQVPKVFRLLREWRAEAEARHAAERERWERLHGEAIAMQRADNKESLRAILEHCEKTAQARDQDLSQLEGVIENLQEAIESLGAPRLPRRGRKNPPTSDA